MLSDGKGNLGISADLRHQRSLLKIKLQALNTATLGKVPVSSVALGREGFDFKRVESLKVSTQGYSQNERVGCPAAGMNQPS